LQTEELDECRFAPESELSTLLPDSSLRRVLAALAALSSGCVRYVPDAVRG
jgi:hypothetical protein